MQDTDVQKYENAACSWTLPNNNEINADAMDGHIDAKMIAMLSFHNTTLIYFILHSFW